jgi:hypothetical protein
MGLNEGNKYERFVNIWVINRALTREGFGSWALLATFAHGASSQSLWHENSMQTMNSVKKVEKISTLCEKNTFLC